MLTSAPTIDFSHRRELLRLRQELARLRDENERLSALAYRDALTGLRNRRCFSERLGEELCRLRRHPGGALCVLAVDLNGFKQLNDTRGHAAGDLALVVVARMLETLVRTEDLVCRVGGDEFAVLLPDTDARQAQRVVERIRGHLPALGTAGLGSRGLALGLASWQPGDDEALLCARADVAMYADKRAAQEGGARQAA